MVDHGDLLWDEESEDDDDCCWLGFVFCIGKPGNNQTRGWWLLGGVEQNGNDLNQNPDGKQFMCWFIDGQKNKMTMHNDG